jgi:hypothetical protein
MIESNGLFQAVRPLDRVTRDGCDCFRLFASHPSDPPSHFYNVLKFSLAIAGALT